MTTVIELPYAGEPPARQGCQAASSGPTAMTTTLAMTLRKCSARLGSGGATFKHDGSQVVSAGEAGWR